tara:strand:+ start:73 stop:795 length:723 start_codon:yes stop_codon:yes gene_type:complete
MRVKLIERIEQQHIGGSSINKIRSFVVRSGRITIAQNRALEQLLPKYANLTEIRERIEHIKSTGNQVNLEIGLGDGKNLIHMAKENPNSIFLGSDVHLPGIGSTLNSLELHNINNVRVLVGDINDTLLSFGRIFQNIFIFFPDPWPKKRHNKRRLINREFLDLIAKKIKVDCKIYIATDCKDYATSILNVIEISKEIENSEGSWRFSKRPSWRLLTKFERRALQANSRVYEICCIPKNID